MHSIPPGMLPPPVQGSRLNFDDRLRSMEAKLDLIEAKVNLILAKVQQPPPGLFPVPMEGSPRAPIMRGDPKRLDPFGPGLNDRHWNKLG